MVVKKSLLCRVLLLSCINILVACTDKIAQPIADCRETVDTRLAAFPFADTPDRASEWITVEYGLSASDVGRDLSGDGIQTFVRWKPSQDQIYSALIWNDDRESASVTQRWLENAPTVKDAIRCLGDPQRYRAYYSLYPEAEWTSLELWYPAQGVVVTVDLTYKARSFSATQAIALVQYVEPGSIEALVPRVDWLAPAGSTRYSKIIQGLKVWPGNIEQVTIEERK